MKTVIGALAYEHSKPESKCPHLVCLNEVFKSHEQFGDQRPHQVLKERKNNILNMLVAELNAKSTNGQLQQSKES